MRSVLLPLLFFSCSLTAQVKHISVYFPFALNTPEFTETANLLYFLDDSLAEKNDWLVEIKAYCDNVDDDTVNNILSQQRADNMRDVLLHNGIRQEDIVKCQGYGEKIALNKNATEEERKVNRRADITFISKKMSQQEITKYEDTQQTTTKVLKDSIHTEDLIEGETLILDNLNFQPGRHILLPRSVPTLKQLLKAMQENPNLEIEITGHICCELPGKTDGYDMDTKKEELSLNRAKEVKNYLVKNGIDEGRMTVSGKGASQKLIYPEITETDMETNRRVEILVKKS